jgi:concentrative nucleoside transporter, CNT family
LLNYLMGQIGDVTGLNAYLMSNFNQTLSFQFLFGSILQFLAFSIGVPWDSAYYFGSLLGTKVVLNEFVAYLDMSKLIELKNLTNPKAILMATYALCGFANFSSIAIQIGGISPLAPERRGDLAKLGIRALIAGTLATLLTATLAGIMA